MKDGTYKISIRFEQLLEAIRQLPKREKIKLSKELEKDIVSNKLSDLLDKFYTEELTTEIINEEVEAVRSEMYAGKTKKGNN